MRAASCLGGKVGIPGRGDGFVLVRQLQDLGWLPFRGTSTMYKYVGGSSEYTMRALSGWPDRSKESEVRRGVGFYISTGPDRCQDKAGMRAVGSTSA